MGPEAAPGRLPAAARAAALAERPTHAPPGTRAVAATRLAALALALAFAAVVLLPACSVYFVKVLHVPQSAVLPVCVPAAALFLLGALGLARWSRGTAATDGADEADVPRTHAKSP